MLRKTGSHRALKPSVRATATRRAEANPPTPKPKQARSQRHDVDTDQPIIEEMGPGKNVLVRRRMLREESGTHETLKILDDSVVDGEEESGLDPYNTGRFDRSKYWDKRFLK